MDTFLLAGLKRWKTSQQANCRSYAGFLTLETNLYKYELYAGELSRNDIFKLRK